MRRREFLRVAGGASAVALLGVPGQVLAGEDPYLQTIGLQLYTLRNQLPADLAGTLKRVAEAGYRQVELMKVVGEEPTVNAARDAGLKVTSAMIDWRTLVDPHGEGVPSPQATLETATALGLKYLVFGYIGKGHRETEDQFKALAERANRAGEHCRNAGIQLCYHHHSFEFGKLPSGRTGWDVFVREFDPQLVPFEIDVFWVAVGGQDPVKTLRDLKGRVAQVHLKDVARGIGTIHDEGQVPPEAFLEVGSGVLNWPAILAAAHAAGARQCHVEQDHSPDPLASIAKSLKYLRALPVGG